MTGSDPIVVESGQITTIRLENPPLNLVTVELTRSLDRALATIEGDPDVRCVVLTGTGDRAFCAGSDVKEFESLQGRVGEGKLLLEKAVYRRIARLPVPTIAAIQADALGGGLELALCCDLRVADERGEARPPRSSPRGDARFGRHPTAPQDRRDRQGQGAHPHGRDHQRIRCPRDRIGEPGRRRRPSSRSMR